MKLIRQNERYRCYRLRAVDAQLFIAVLNHFPCLKQGYQRASMTGEGPAIDEAEALLMAATAERTRKHQRELRRWLRAPGRFKAVEGKLELRIELRRIEWLLQILNDVRVGLWVRLGSPQNMDAAARSASQETFLQYVLMDAAGMFQTALLGDGSA